MASLSGAGIGSKPSGLFRGGSTRNGAITDRADAALMAVKQVHQPRKSRRSAESATATLSIKSTDACRKRPERSINRVAIDKKPRIKSRRRGSSGIAANCVRSSRS